MRPIGLILILLSALPPLYGVVMLASQHPNTPLASQYFGMIALIFMAITQFLATRLSIVSWIFGPLDKTYVLHKWLGIISLVLILLHDTIGAEIKNLGPEGAWSDLGEELGELGLNGILVLVGLSLALFIPYNWWKLTHKLMGAFFVLCFLHYVMIDKPIGLSEPVGLYVTVLCLIGVLSYALTLVPLRLRSGFEYEVASIEPTGDAHAISMRPVANPLNYRAGQFAFFRFSANGLSEPHPFTISNAPDECGNIRISVKALGRFTKKMGNELTVGTKVKVQGPFGHFGAKRGKAPQVWVAAGIGVTPFLAMLDTWSEERPEVAFFYTFRGEGNAPHLKEARAKAAALQNVTLYEIDTAIAARISGDMIAEKMDFALEKSRVLYCGPTGLRKTLAANLKGKGVSARCFHYEVFEIRSDIWPLDRINNPLSAAVTRMGF